MGKLSAAACEVQRANAKSSLLDPTVWCLCLGGDETLCTEGTSRRGPTDVCAWIEGGLGGAHRPVKGHEQFAQHSWALRVL